MAIPYELDSAGGKIKRLGLIVLQSDETIENEFRQMFSDPAIALYHTRISSAPEVTPETLALMEKEIPHAVQMFPRVELDAIGYACTSGATVIGPDNIAKAVQSIRPTTLVTDPLTATIAWCRANDVKRLGFLTPYIASVSESMRTKLIDAGLEIVSFGSFEQEDEHTVATISEASILAAAEVIDTAECQAIFISCTNLRALNVVKDAQQILEKPVISSNTALAWHLRELGKLNPSG